MNRKLLSGVTLFCVYAAVTASLADELRVRHIANGDDVVVMGDARVESGAEGCADDFVLRTTGTVSTPKNLLAPKGCSSEIAIFAASNAMLLQTRVKTWTNGNTDVHTSNMKPLLNVPLRIWTANPAAASDAVDYTANANLLYEQNKIGVQFVPVYTTVDPADVPTIESGIQLTANGSDYECTNLAAIQQSKYYKKKTLNVYFIGKAITGRNCAILSSSNPVRGDGDITFIGSTANIATLAHELGHAFGLRPANAGGHTNNLAGFGPDNIMWGGGLATRNRFTLGQAFRMNTERDTWGGTMLIANALRPHPGRSCPPLTTTPKCPALDKDWARP